MSKAKLVSLFLILVFAIPVWAVAPAAPSGTTASSGTFSASPALAIADAATVTTTINVTGMGTNLLDVDMTTFITHTSSADLDITLTSPAGTTIVITTDNGGGNDNVFNGTLWDDSATNPASDATYTNLVTASPLVPEGAFGAFMGENPNGNWTISITDDTAGSVGNLASWSLAVTTISPTPTLINNTLTNAAVLALPDGTVSSTIIVTGLESYLFDVNMTTNITHTASNHLDITLTSPAGTTIVITTDNGGANDNNFNGTVWNDDAPTANTATDFTYANLVTATPLVPEGALAKFIGEDPNGTWTLTITDDTAGQTGSLSSWSLAFQTVGVPVYASTPSTGAVAMNTNAGTPVNQTISVSEAGTADLVISSASYTGDAEITLTTNPAPFTIADGGAAVDLILTCTSAVGGTFTGTLTVAHNAAGSPATYNITCTVLEPVYVSSPVPGPISMSTVPAVAVTQTITVSEGGTGDLSVTSASYAGDAAISLSTNPAPFTITDGSGTTFDLVLTCNSAVGGTFTGTLTVTHNGTTSPETYNISCAVGTPLYGSTPAPGAVSMTTNPGTPDNQTITVSEVGAADLSITGATLTGDPEITLTTNPAPFTISDGSGATFDFVVTCVSAVNGTFTASLNVAHNAAGSPANYTITCVVSTAPIPGGGGSGTGTGSTASPNIGVFDPAISKIGFLTPGQTGVVGEELEWVVTVSNTGAVAGTNVTVTDTLISALQVDSVDAPGAVVTINGQTVSVVYPSLAVGQTVQFSIFTTVLQGVQISNTACVMASNQAAQECASASPISQLPVTGETSQWRIWFFTLVGTLFGLAVICYVLSLAVDSSPKKQKVKVVYK